jgi:pilus assembly protein CpaE
VPEKIISVVIVDDAADTRESIRRLLNLSIGLAVVGEAENGQQAIERVAELKPNVVLMDINMPVMDGITATERICAAYPDTVVIVISVQGEMEYLRKAMIAGAKDYLVKPFGADEVVDCIQRTWEREWQRRISQAKPITSDKPPGQVVSVYSPKGGVGKTTIAVNLASLLASDRRKKVCLIDLNLQFGDVCILLSLIPRRTISDLVNEQTVDKEAVMSYLLNHPCGLKVLPAPLRPEHAEYVTSDHVSRIIAICKDLFDYVIIDTPASFHDVVLTALDASDRILMVSCMDMPSLKNVKLGLQVMNQLNYKEEKIFLLLNRAGYDYGIKFKDLEPAFGRAVNFFILSDDITAMTAANRGLPFVLDQGDTKLARRYFDLVDEHFEPKTTENRSGLGWRRRKGGN